MIFAAIVIKFVKYKNDDHAEMEDQIQQEWEL